MKDSVIDIEIELTANHKGRFELKLCPVAAGRKEATQECLDRWGTGCVYREVLDWIIFD